MPVNENVRGRKRSPVGIQSIALTEVTFDFEIELLGKIAG